MVSTNTKFIVNKQTLNSFPLAGIKHSIKDPFPLARKTVSAVRNKKMEEISLTQIQEFKNCVHQ